MTKTSPKRYIFFFITSPNNLLKNLIKTYKSTFGAKQAFIFFSSDLNITCVMDNVTFLSQFCKRGNFITLAVGNNIKINISRNNGFFKFSCLDSVNEFKVYFTAQIIISGV